jgi:ADP-ribosyl-[dinitrogen reductase] hydrolase
MTVANKDKVRGLFLGTAIGDALGMPVEGQPYEKIKEKYGRLENYVSAAGHKWFDGQPLGSWTDDTQLTVSVAEGLIEAGCLDLDVQVKHHVKAYKTHTSGWGRTTREAIERLANGVHWRESGLYSSTEADEGVKKLAVRGFGNGVAMKAAPIGAFLASASFDWKAITEQLADFTAMTHRTSMAVSSCLAHAFASFRCMVSTPETFNVRTFIATVVNASELGKAYYKETLTDDDITKRFKLLETVNDKWTTEDIVREFGKGTYYVYNSLPFTYAFFVRNPKNIESLYDCASAGGDTDSNASMLGALLGALNGTAIFPKHLLDGLHEKQELIRLADAFSEKFGI